MSLKACRIPLLVVCCVVVHSLFGGELRRWFDLEGRPVVPSPGRSIRVATWNLRNFPRETRDRDRVADNLRNLQADLIAVQEVFDPAALRELLPGWDIHLSQRGGRGHQLLGVVFDPERIEVVSPLREHESLELGGRVRPAVSIEVRSRRSDLQWTVVVVHLKARPQGIGKRREQWPALAEVVDEVVARAATRRVVVLGDFNLTGPPGGSPSDELAELERVLHNTRGARLHLVANREGCSAYWEGGRRDRWKEPSLLDLIWVGGLEQQVTRTKSHSFAHCARHRCRPFRADSVYPDLDYEAASDHCPVVVDFAPGH